MTGLPPCQWRNTSRREMARSLLESMLCTMLTMLCSILATPVTWSWLSRYPTRHVAAATLLHLSTKLVTAYVISCAMMAPNHTCCAQHAYRCVAQKTSMSLCLYFCRITCKGLVNHDVLLSEPWSLPMQPWPPGQILRGRCSAGLIGRVSFLQAMASKRISGM